MKKGPLCSHFIHEVMEFQRLNDMTKNRKPVSYSNLGFQMMDPVHHAPLLSKVSEKVSVVT